MKECDGVSDDRPFEICSGNSDSECFMDHKDTYEDDIKESEKLVNLCPRICDICVYNKKFKDYNYDEWNLFREKIGIEPK